MFLYLFIKSDEIDFIALILEGFLYGFYSGILAIYVQYQASKQDTNMTQNTLFYSMCALYVSSTAIFYCDIVLWLWPVQALLPKQVNRNYILFMQKTLFACCDFIAQFILIYRCWIVWGRNIRIMIIPSMLAFAFLAIWIVDSRSDSGDFGTLEELYPMTMPGLALSLAVNALVTGLIVFRIFKVFREVKTTSNDKILGATSGRKLRCIILVIIESAMALFSIQLARLVVGGVWMAVTSGGAYPLISAIHEMLTGITPTIILVRTSMGLSFHDEKSMEDVAIGSLRFADHPNSAPEIVGSDVGIIGQDVRDDDDIEIQQINDIDVVERS